MLAPQNTSQSIKQLRLIVVSSAKVFGEKYPQTPGKANKRET